MSQREVTIVGHNNTKAAVTGQQELLVKVNSFGVSGLATEATALDILAECQNILQSINDTKVEVLPAFYRSSGVDSITGADVLSVSVSNVGTANGTFLGSVLKPGETLNVSAGGTQNYFNSSGAIYWDATGTEFLIVYTTL